MENSNLNVAGIVADLKSIPSGKVVDLISGRLLNDTPEEYVRQNIAMSLILEYGYDRNQIETEFPVRVGSTKKRLDIAIFDGDSPHRQDTVRIIVEAKKPDTKPSDRKQGVEQLHSYMAACANCTYGLWTNGDDRAVYKKVQQDGVFEFLDALDIPLAGTRETAGPRRKLLRSATGDNLLFAFRRCHNYIAGNQGLQKPEAFWELLRVIFCKIEDERTGTDPLSFFVTETERFSMNGQSKAKLRILRLFDDVKRKYPTIFAANESIDLKGAVLAYVVAQLQGYSLLNTSVDVKGIAYEEIVGSNLRGDRGEFFTPRNACRMAVTMLNPQPNETILDPACVTGGFLVIAMQHVLRRIEDKHRHMRSDPDHPTPEETQEYFRERSEFLSKNITGLDLNPNLVRAAKMNMVMNNDGSGQLFQTNSLEHPHRWDQRAAEFVPLGSVDVIFTNPPFGTRIRIDEPRILAQYDVAAKWQVEEDGEPEIRISEEGVRLLQGAAPPEVLFVERCLQWLRPGGRLAIVMPNGLLNNPGLRPFRQAILRKAQLLGVVDMHRDLFQPQNDTQTSMVLFRKWMNDAEREQKPDYPIFMAIADTIGHDKRGVVIHNRNPDGSLVLQDVYVQQEKVVNDDKQNVWVATKAPIVDDDLPIVAEKYHRWLRAQAERLRLGERFSA